MEDDKILALRMDGRAFQLLDLLHEDARELSTEDYVKLLRYVIKKLQRELKVEES